MPLPYNLNFPEALDYMRDSQPLMLENYASIFTFIVEDHVPFNDGIDRPGQHLQMTFPEIVAPANPTASLPVLFGQLSNNSQVTQLFIQNALNSINGFSDSLMSPIGLGRINWAVLPSGIVLKWVFLPAIHVSSPPIVQTYTWGNQLIEKPFTQQFWSIVVPLQSNPNQDFPASENMIYVTSLTPSQVNYTVWFNQIFGSQQARIPERIIFSIGV